MSLNIDLYSFFMRVWEGGLKSQWLRMFSRPAGHPCHVSRPPNSKTIITLVDFSGVFLLLAAGIALSFLIFILERIVFNGMKSHQGIPERQVVPSINTNAEKNLEISDLDLIPAIDAVLEETDVAGQITKEVDATKDLQQSERSQMEQRTCSEEPDFVLDVLARKEDEF